MCQSGLAERGPQWVPKHQVNELIEIVVVCRERCVADLCDCLGNCCGPGYPVATMDDQPSTAMDVLGHKGGYVGDLLRFDGAQVTILPWKGHRVDVVE